MYNAMFGGKCIEDEWVGGLSGQTGPLPAGRRSRHRFGYFCDNLSFIWIVTDAQIIKKISHTPDV